MMKPAIATMLAAAIWACGTAASCETLVLDLKSASQLAIKTSPQLGSAVAAVDMYKAGIGKAKSGLYATLSLQSGYSYLSKETVFGTTPVWTHDTLVNSISAQQVIYSGGQVEAGVSRAKFAYNAAGSQMKAAQAEVLTGVATAYFRSRQASEAITVAEDSVRSLKASHDAASKMRDAGLVTKSDVLRAEVALASARAGLITAKNDYSVALASLKTAMGLSQDADVQLAANPSDTAPDAANSAAPVERPEVAAQTASVSAADAAKREAKAGNMPTVALSADYMNEPTGSQFPRQSDTLLVGVAVKFNVLDGGLTRSNIAEAQAAATQAGRELEAQKQQVELEQRSAKLNLESASARVEVTASQVQSAEESLRALQAGYKEGITPLTDVLSAEAALTSARALRISALYDVKIAQVNLLRAYGLTDALIR